MLNIILSECKEKEDTLLALRRELHKFPEIGGELPRTKKIVCSFLEKYGISYAENPDDDGVVAWISGGNAGKCIAFRADMDGLHINEETAVPFRSEIKGQMHGCGHDAHTATLLVAAAILNEKKEELNGTVRFLFQTGEETGTGAKEMIKQGALDGVDAICALHVGNLAGEDHNAGDVIVLPGAVSAGKNKFTLTVYGKGTHSAFPEKGIDPILIGAKIIQACADFSKSEHLREKAAVLSFGSFNAGIYNNTIPDTAILKGSIWAQNETLRNYIGEWLASTSECIAESVGARCVADIHKGSATVMNNHELSDFVQTAIGEALGRENIITKTSSALKGSDDFANYASRVPAVYFFLHTNNEGKGIVEANHNPNFNIDESVLWKGVACYVAIAQKFLK